METKPMNIEQYAQGLVVVCINHRRRYGINEEPRINDCKIKPCRTGCPILKMPQALTSKELKEVEKEVLFEEIQEMKQSKVRELKQEG